MAQIRWLRILLAAVVIEVVLLAIAIPLNLSAGGQAVLRATVVPLCLIATFLGGWWVARGAGTRFWVHGLLLGAAAALIYGALTWKVTLPESYIVANYLKLLGGVGGGLLARKLSQQNAGTAI